MIRNLSLATHLSGRGKAGQPALILMHFLGGSGKEWDQVIGLLGDTFRAMTIDLPGFGDSAGVAGYSVAEMARSVEAAILESIGHHPYVLVGHSMSGKVAMVLARQQASLPASPMAGLVLIAPSPPSPEPMTEEKRTGMIAALGEANADPQEDLRRAAAYITKNETRDIPIHLEKLAAEEVLRMNRAAWVAWLTQGSREDWRERVGLLTIPALVIAGEKDAGLGPDAQRRFTMPHLANGKLEVVQNCSHLIPLEKAAQLANIIKEFLSHLDHSPVVPESYLSFIAGERVSAPTRDVLKARMKGPAPAEGILSPIQIATLTVLLARVIPQDGPNRIDLVGFVLARLATGKGDGWRFAVLPEDVQAYRQGLDRLEAQGFLTLDPAAQNAILHRMSVDRQSPEALWFEDVRGDAVAAYVGHPTTLARMGYSGIGVGGAETKYQGFVAVGLNDREDWEPVPVKAGKR